MKSVEINDHPSENKKCYSSKVSITAKTATITQIWQKASRWRVVKIQVGWKSPDELRVEVWGIRKLMKSQAFY